MEHLWSRTDANERTWRLQAQDLILNGHAQRLAPLGRSALAVDAHRLRNRGIVGGETLDEPVRLGEAARANELARSLDVVRGAAQLDVRPEQCPVSPRTALRV